MRILAGKLVSAFVAGTLAVTPALAKEPERKEVYGPPDEKTVPVSPPVSTASGFTPNSQRLPALENLYPDHTLTQSMEIADGVFGTIKPVRARISIPFGYPRK